MRHDWRDLLYGLVGWVLGSAAYASYPVSSAGETNLFANVVAAWVFEPVGMLLSVSFSLFATSILITVFSRNLKQLRGQMFHFSEWLIASILTLLAGGLLLVQLGKFPLLTGTVLALGITRAIVVYWRTRSVHAEMKRVKDTGS